VVKTTNTIETDPAQTSSKTGDLNLDKVEKSTIEAALKQYRYNISHTAKALGLTRAALYRRMEKHGL
jgi:transcriptional regulator of acetoin/glycerol metabolism